MKRLFLQMKTWRKVKKEKKTEKKNQAMKMKKAKAQTRSTSMTRTDPGRYLIVILGPTAVGKTSLAIQLAKELRTEILSADSRQFYREMNIGTAKPTAQQLKEVKHHFINSLSVTDEYNVGTFERDALKVLEEIFKAPLFPPKAGSTQAPYL